MPDKLVVLDGSTFFVSDGAGDTDGSEATGFFFQDVRHLARWSLSVDGTPMRVLTSRVIDYYSARIFGTRPIPRVGANPSISIQRDRIVAGGVHEDLWLRNHSEVEQQITLELEFGCDFADIFELKDGDAASGATTTVEVAKRAVTMWHERGGSRRATRIEWTADGRADVDRLHFEITLAPRGEWHTCLDVSTIVGGERHGARSGHGGIGTLEPQLPRSLADWLEDAPEVETDSDLVAHTYRRSLVDLAALRFRPLPGLTWSLPAAGLPWFMALFGRDSLLTAYMALPFQPHLAATTLEALSELQATEHDDFRDAEPGKVVHEVRRGWQATLAESPHAAYYGTHDATPLFLVLLDEYERWTGDRELVRRLEAAARAALAWIEGPGDPDGDGYLEYETRSSKGLRNQGWKDSWNAILFADGRLAEPPIAMCEIQGYAYDARRRVARLARVCWGDDELADRLDRDAADLRERFDRDFWLEERGHYALALDGAKRPVDALTSNVGHLLWSGIVPEARAEGLRERLMAPDMFSGWGTRTMSSLNAGYNPIEYHDGTVWPHDTAIVAEGLRRYGFREDASGLAWALFEAAGAFEYRLPEVFAGFDRETTAVPVEYPTASRPQAWAAAAPMLAIRTLLGLDAEDGTITEAPFLGPHMRVLRRRPR
ncbi:MAG: amylo-alpha-1,6-glucosidase [Chloroflexi bacterium]|nr:amylo-alpha-1,6-glucosidase [Chloroflexota bacterium]MBA3778120.1 amylo-alpha-1,6-glucosidase [Chloroflexota bacterium]